MDLITQLINNKKNIADVPLILGKMLDEIIKYEKLSKSPKFKSIVETPMLQKQMPEIWKSFNGDSQAMFIFDNAMSIVQQVSDTPLQVFQDYTNHYDNKKKSKLSTIGNAGNFQFMFLSLDAIPRAFDYEDENIMIITDDVDDQNYAIAIIHYDNTSATVYQGRLSNKKHEDVKVNHVVQPFTRDYENCIVTIDTYSVQGNNDYDFASIGPYRVSMPDNHHIQYRQGFSTQGYIVEMDETDVALLGLHKNDIGYYADMIYKYVPKGETALEEAN